MDVRHSRFLKSAYRRAVYNPIPGGAVVPKNEHGSPVRVGMAPLMAALNSDADDDWDQEELDLEAQELQAQEHHDLGLKTIFFFDGGVPTAIAGRDWQKDDKNGWEPEGWGRAGGAL